MSLLVLLLSEDEGLGSLDHSVTFGFGLGALKLKHDLLGLLSLLLEHWLGLTTESLLLHVVSSLSLGSFGVLTLLVLRDFVDGVLLQLAAESSNRLWDMYHFAFSSCSTK